MSRASLAHLKKMEKWFQRQEYEDVFNTDVEDRILVQEMSLRSRVENIDDYKEGRVSEGDTQ